MLANVSANEDGRKILIEKQDFLMNIFRFLFFQNKQRRVGALKTIRNITFEYENPKISEFLTQNDMIDMMHRYVL